ncbi:MAG: toll/interleukin-1 receptor domain-containing protein [Planctomycetota bacterium]
MHAFFTSYASGDGQKEFKQCLQRLRELVGNKTGWAAQNLCFFDADSLKNGDEWQPLLAEAVRTAKVAVCFVSLRFLQSPWCGRELTVFHDRCKLRDAAGTAAGGRFVFLLVWEAIKGWEWPLPLRPYQYRDASLPPQYVEGGLRKMASLFPQIFESVMESVSDAIRDAVLDQQPLPEAAVFDGFDAVPNALAVEPMAYDYWLAVAAPQGSHWTPPGAPDDVGMLVSKRAALSNVTARLLPLDKSCGPRSAQAAVDRQVVILVSDGATSATEVKLTAMNKADIPSLVLVVVDAGPASGQAPFALDAWIKGFAVGAFAAAAAAGRARSCLPNELVVTLDTLITRVLQQLRAEDPPKAVASAAILETALEQGVPVSARAMLAGPGDGGRP